jgi:hypothetical protein
MTELRASLATAERRGGDQPGAAFDARLAQLADIVSRLQDSVETQGELLDRLAQQVLPPRSRARREDAQNAAPSSRGGPEHELG